jgi:hypothetical protein
VTGETRIRRGRARLRPRLSAAGRKALRSTEFGGLVIALTGRLVVGREHSISKEER